jgi:FG-GAP-like repeat
MRHFITRSLPICLGILFSLMMLAAASARAQTNPSPFLYPLYPAATQPGGPVFSLTVTGTGFVSGAVVNWNGSPRPTTFVNSSRVTAAITAADIATSKTALITVTNPPPGGGTSNPQYFQVTFPTASVTFQDSLLPTGPYVTRVLVGDFNGDGKPDVVTVQNGYAIQILLGNGDGTFQAPATVIASPNLINDLAVADLNGDGKLDLVGSFESSQSVPYSYGTFAFLGNGDGTFQPPLVSDNNYILAYISAYRTVIADVNGDGIPDLVRACRTGVCVELGNGDGTFRVNFIYSVQSPTGGFQRAKLVAVGDFHNNGKLDIIAGIEPYYLVILPGNGDGTFGAASVVAAVDSTILDDFAVDDFDRDGNLDLEVYYCMACTSAAPSTAAAMTLLRGNGDGTFQPPLTLPGLPESTYDADLSRGSLLEPTLLVPGDFNGDGNIDLAVQNVVVLIGNASGPLSHSIVPTPNVASAAADFNGDGRLDLIGIDSNQNVHVLLQTSVPDFLGSINGPGYQDVVPGGTSAYTITVTSVNGFAGTIQFSASGLPAGATASFTPSTLAGSGTVTVTITTLRHTPKGSYPILVSGTSVGITHSGGIILNVGREEESEDFGGTVSPAWQTAIPGGSTTFQINIFPISGFDSDVRLTVRGLPPGATATFNPPDVTDGSGSTVLTISTANPTLTNTYHLTVIGTGGGRRHDNGMNLNVGPAGTDFTDYTGSITPLSQTVQAGGVTSFTVTIQPINGTGCVYLQVYGLPPATNGHFDPTTGICGAPASTVFTITTSPQTPPGTYILQFQGTTSAGFVHSRYVTLTVTP